MAKNRFELTGNVWRQRRRHGSGLGRKILVLGIIGGIAWSVSHTARPTPVVLVTAQQKDMNLLAQGIGNVQPSQSVIVRPLAAGQISEITFQEGQEVKKGDVLARIDPSLYQAQLAQAQANKQQDEAQIESVRTQLRALGPLSKKPTPQQQALLASLHQFEAAVKSDTATIQQTQALLAHTTITAPMDGRLGIRRIDAGNLVQANDSNGLVEITRMNPVSVIFTLPEQHLPGLSALLKQQQPIAVSARDLTSGEVLAQGTLDLADNQVNTESGALRLKASFSNENRQLWPGAMVQVQLSLGTLPSALVVPQAALVRRGPQHFVYKVNTGSKTISLQPVKLLLTQGDEVAIAEGLAPGDQLAVEPSAITADNRIQQLGSISPAR